MPKINIQLKKILRKKAPTAVSSGMCICPVFRRTMVVVMDKP